MAKDVIWHPSPNFGMRRDGGKPRIVVIHYTAMKNAEAALDWLCTPEAEVSAHYLICPRGRAFNLVTEDNRAWHAGAGRWRDVTDVNSSSIGIELANTGFEPFPEPQMARLETLLADIIARHGIAPRDVIGHSDMAPGRKIDPGSRFDWRRLAMAGLAHWPAEGTTAIKPNWTQFRALAQARGFTAEVNDETLLSAVRLRYCPWNHGALNAHDMNCVSAR